MLYLLCFIAGLILASVLTAQTIHRRHGNKMCADETKYKGLWEGALELLTSGGQVTNEQLAHIMPPEKIEHKTLRLPKQSGFSSDRRDIEIARAKAGLSPADNLHGMFSSDIREVEKARIKYGTVT